MHPSIEAKNTAYLKHNQQPTAHTLRDLRSARSEVQKNARHYANQYWTTLCESIQKASDTGNLREMYNGIKLAIGPSVKKVAPLKSKDGDIISDKSKQMDRWVEHYLELYSEETEVAQTAIDDLPRLPTMHELDAEPTIEELGKALDLLSSGKAPGNDGIPAEVLKCSKASLLPILHGLLIKCWREGSVPQDMRDANIHTLYKNKGDKGDCNNYRGISLLSITGKLYARVVLWRLQKLADRIYPEAQCGFRSGRSTIDMIFSLRQLQEKCQEQQKPLYIAFVDLTKAFDTVSRSGLYKILEKIGCPPRLLSLVESFHEDMQSTVNFDGTTSASFKIKKGVKQGCVLAATLFCIFFSMLLSYAFKGTEDDIHLYTRSDGKLFNMRRLQAKSKRRKISIKELLFADDAALVAHSESKLQALIDRLQDACEKFSLTISVKKTVVMAQGVKNPPVVKLNNTPLEVVSKFCYLGSTTTESSTLDDEINTRIGKAATTFGRLTKRAWRNPKLTTKTKMSIYQACILSTLLYGSETWTSYSYQEKKLNSFHLRCLRRLFEISWMDKVSNEEVLQRASLPTVSALIKQRRLRWLGHVRRMDDGRIPKDLLYGEIAEAKRPVGRPKLRFKDVCKRDLKAMGMPADSWEAMAENRVVWRSTIHEGVKYHDKGWFNQLAKKREKRKCGRAHLQTPS